MLGLHNGFVCNGQQIFLDFSIFSYFTILSRHHASLYVQLSLRVAPLEHYLILSNFKHKLTFEVANRNLEWRKNLKMEQFVNLELGSYSYFISPPIFKSDMLGKILELAMLSAHPNFECMIDLKLFFRNSTFYIQEELKRNSGN